MNSKRILLPDIVRSFSILWIVAFWHIFDYVEPRSWQQFFLPITYAALVSFTFLSGLFLGKKEMKFSVFYINRLKRFVPLFGLSVVLFRYFHLISTKQMILTITGLSSFILPQPLTLWYFSMLIVFYLVTPFLLYKLNIFSNSRDYKLFIIRALVLYLSFLLLSCLGFLDNRLLIYYPIYILGIVFPLEKLNYVWRNRLALVIFGSVIMFGGFLIYLHIGTLIQLGRLFMGFGGMMVIFSLSSMVERCINSTGKHIIETLSYISMSTYLFHRIVYLIMKHLYSVEYLSSIEILVMILVMLSFAFVIQKCYDITIKRLFD